MTATSVEQSADTVMMGVMHDALRRDFARIRDVLSDPAAPGDVQRVALAEHVLFMLVFLDGHHHSEDANLWPRVRAKDPSLGPLLDSMSRDHEQIATQVEALSEAAQGYAARSDEATRVALLAAIDRCTAVLVPHLDREEAELMPRVSACLTEHEWRAFEKSAKPDMPVSQLAEYFNWFLDDLDEVRRRKIMRALPPPVVFVSTKVFGPGYRRRAGRRWTAQAANNHAGAPRKTFMKRAMRAANKMATSLYRRSNGRIGGTAKGTPVFLLTVAGRKTGTPFTVPVSYFKHGDDYVVMGSAGGTKTDPQWIRNLQAAGTAQVQIGGAERFTVDAKVLDGAERDDLWQNVVLANAPFAAKYEEKSGRVIPVAVLTFGSHRGGESR